MATFFWSVVFETSNNQIANRGEEVEGVNGRGRRRRVFLVSSTVIYMRGEGSMLSGEEVFACDIPSSKKSQSGPPEVCVSLLCLSLDCRIWTPCEVETMSSSAVGLEFQGSTRRTCKRTCANQPSTIGGSAAVIQFLSDECVCMRPTEKQSYCEVK
jgi:hypothetical protein